MNASAKLILIWLCLGFPIAMLVCGIIEIKKCIYASTSSTKKDFQTIGKHSYLHAHRVYTFSIDGF